MRRPLIAGNWKMNALRSDGEALAAALESRRQAAGTTAFDMVLCPPFTLLETVGRQIAGGAIMLGGQDCHPEDKGAHTGDISPAQLADAGCGFVIVGHSERREDHGEDDALVRRKAEAAQRHGMAAIVCVGETQAQRDAGETFAVLDRQVSGSVPPGSDSANLVVAYEPVWAIGTGRSATPDDVAQAHSHLRQRLETHLGRADGLRLLYGGSVKPANAGELLALADVDGALVGGASLKPDDFWGIAEAAG